MKKLCLLFFVLVLLGTVSAMAQTITGRVVSEGDNEPLPGVAVLEKGTNHGAATDFDGNYTFNLQNPDGAVLVFSFMGYETQEVSVDGRTSIDVVLKSNNIAVDEVVVTALGIKREAKTLTYSSQQVDGDEMMKARDINFMGSLSGKTAGLEIRKSTSGAGGSTRTVLRGSKSLTMSGDPLYVIDGVPMVNNKGGQSGMWGGTDEGDGLSQINPDDIESVSVLKGATAAILYGSAGANGVVIINTKKGKDGATSVSFSSAGLFESIISEPKLQYRYGSEGGAAESWSYTKGNYDNKFVDDFFETGYNLVNTLSVSSGNGKQSTYFSYGNTSAGGVVPNNSYQKHNITFKESTKFLEDKISLSSSVMLATERTKNRNTGGYYLNPLTGLYLFPRSGATPWDGTSGAQDFSYFKENYQYFDTDRNMYTQNWFVDNDSQSNPYWLINKQPKEDLTKRVIASLTLEYQIAKNLKFQARGSYDYSVKSFEQKFYAGGNTTNIGTNGRWNYKKFEDKQAYADGIFTYNNDFGDISLTAIAGASYQQSVFGDGVSVDNGVKTLLYPNEFYFHNMPDNVEIESTYGGKIIKEGAFANIQLGYKNLLFLDLSGRNDWSSTLALTGNQSYFYPSVGLSGILSQMVKLPDFVDFAKVRASASQVNNEIPWGKILVLDKINSVTNGIDKNTIVPFTDAKPEQLVTYEAGTDWRFLNGRLGFDFSYYYIVSTNQALLRNLESSEQYESYTQTYYNAGKIVNQGVELVLNATPVKTNNFTWNSTVNFSRNKNKVKELDPQDPEKYQDFGSSEGYVARVYSGGSIGDIYGIKFRRNDAGQIMLDDAGKPLKTASNDLQYLGNLDPKFSLGWNNSFNYKQFSLGFLVNAKIGGKAFSQTESILDGYGVSERTAAARDKGYVEINGIQGTANVTQVDPQTYYSTVGGRNGVAEAYVYDRTNIRLSQVSLSYDFDVEALKLPIKNASFSLIGNNLFFLYKKAPFDPEMSMSTDMNSQSLDNFNVPATRTYGFNLKVTF
ncbi:TonB-linked SusC/RagA family outer membrane protein [Mangrovibacterium marinum]|uniref:TonB-linked SusC/RagA family outer membrane protein n=1 Tax=Mangrovibacterium marinum TaxID=1639118 RepID=A0A2T5C095_9BACT|nr:SusC/RagA family TonB-linked outer membrane protein [Mangrovibacterium marinum]PTN07992.1 TonB-linked SusC/RagA family outer membrane protein [Mangrovibacterium marinum]